MTESTAARIGETAEPHARERPPEPDSPSAPFATTASDTSFAVVDARHVERRFGDVVALDDVSLSVGAGEIHALLGPNGAGKTTLMRIFTGLVFADSGEISVAGCDPARNTRTLRTRVGLVPSGDRSLYLRLSGLENLLFFARLQGLRRRAALARAAETLDLVDLTDAARVPVGVYSHGMQKRLSFARGLLTAPAVMLVDEATHDLDPQAAENIRGLARELASRGTTIIWTTQRIDEIRGFADSVTFLAAGTVRFEGSVARLIDHGAARRYVLRVRGTEPLGPFGRVRLQRALGSTAVVSLPLADDPEHAILEPGPGRSIGEAIAALVDGGFAVLACRHERSEVEEAFLALSSQASA